jgi:hypothetical protein
MCLIRALRLIMAGGGALYAWTRPLHFMVRRGDAVLECWGWGERPLPWKSLLRRRGKGRGRPVRLLPGGRRRNGATT